MHLRGNSLKISPTSIHLSYPTRFHYITTFSVNDKTPLSAPIPDPIETKKGSGIPKLPAFGVTVVDAFEVLISVKRKSTL